MPTPSTAKWAKPKSEDEFEDIVVDFVRLRWKDPNAQRHGRRGQRQHGVDIVGHPPWLSGAVVGAQCKNVDALTLADITAEVTKALNFPGRLTEFYVVTSSDRDAALQSQVRAHFQANPAPFAIELVFWPDVVADLSIDPALVAKHWQGFSAHAVPKSTLLPPNWIDRDGAQANETTECHCEFAIRMLDCDQLDATELRAELLEAMQSPPSDYTSRSLLTKQPSLAGGVFTWAERHRPYDNVFHKWELEVGDSGHMVRRWSKFSTLPTVQLETYDLMGHVILPLVKYTRSIETWSKSVGTKKAPQRFVLRLCMRATQSPQLDDSIKLVEANQRYASQTSPDTWAVELETDLSAGAPRVAMRLLNRALGQFVEQPSHWQYEDQQAKVVRINEAAYMDCLARFRI
jgi:hypothetical protein